MLKKLPVWITFFSLLLFCFSAKVLAVNPMGPNVRPIEPIIFVMGDCENRDWGTEYSKWGPTGGWWDFKDDKHCWNGGYTPEEYIRKAKQMKVTLDDGTVISKPVGIGIPFTLANIAEWESRLTNPEFDNLAFIVAESGGIYGEVTDEYGKWAGEIMQPLSEAFPKLPIFFQGTIDNLAELAAKAATMPNKNVGVKANGWGYDPNHARRFANLVVDGGEFAYADLNNVNDKITVGFEPAAGGLSAAEWYWAIMQAFYHHPDFFDIQETPMYMIASLDKYGFSGLKFIRDHLSKTPENTPDAWVVLRETKQGSTSGCYQCFGRDIPDPSCKEPTKSCKQPLINCYLGREGIYHCIGPDPSNFTYWLYQMDDMEDGKTVVVSALDLLDPARKYLYSRLYYSDDPVYNERPPEIYPQHYSNLRRTDEKTGNPYMYFDLDDELYFVKQIPKAAGGKVSYEITVSIVNIVNKGTDTFSLEYKNYRGEPIKKIITKGEGIGEVNQWLDYKFENIDDAYFNNGFDGKADFRLNSENDGDEYVHKVVVKSLGTCPSAELGNLNDDCFVDEKDLTILLKQWQPESSAGLLQTLLSNWISE